MKTSKQSMSIWTNHLNSSQETVAEDTLKRNASKCTGQFSVSFIKVQINC